MIHPNSPDTYERICRVCGCTYYIDEQPKPSHMYCTDCLQEMRDSYYEQKLQQKRDGD